MARLSITLCGLAPMSVSHYHFSWIIFMYVLGILYIVRLLVFPWVQTVRPLSQIYFLYCYERDFMLSLKSDTQADIIEAFNSTSRYLDDIFNIDNPFLTLCFLSYTPKSCVLIKQTNLISRRHF